MRIKPVSRWIWILLVVLLTTACSSEESQSPAPIEEAVAVTEEAVEDLSVLEAKASLTFLGRASVRLDFADGRVVYIDPAYGDSGAYEKPADLVLVTHQHSDHNAIHLVTLKEDGQVIQCPYDMTSGSIMEAKGLSIESVDAYNSNHNLRECCGFIISDGDLVIYHSGDTSTTKAMEEFNEYEIDYALLCMDGYWNMGPEEAMSVADLIQAQAVIPIHTSAHGNFDMDQAKAFTHESAMILDIGQSEDLLDLSFLADHVAIPFEDAIGPIMEERLHALETDDYDLYMSRITKKNPYLFNEQERWFMHMSDDPIRNVSFEVISTEKIDDYTGVVNIRQRHQAYEPFDIVYPLLFKYERGKWMDYGYHFEEMKTDRFTIKYMKGEKRVEEFRQMLDDAYDHLAVLYKEKPHEFFEMKLFSDREMLRQRTIPANAWLFTGWSEPDESLKIFTGHHEGYRSYGGVVQHELVHHITIRICKNNLAVWLLEGIAMHDGSAYYPFEDSSLLSRISKDGVALSIAELEAMDLSGQVTPEQITNFYNASYMYVKYICEAYGHDTLMDIFYEAGKKPFHDSTLNEMFEVNNQKTTQEAIQAVLGLSKEELSQEYLTWLDDQKI